MAAPIRTDLIGQWARDRGLQSGSPLPRWPKVRPNNDRPRRVTQDTQLLDNHPHMWHLFERVISESDLAAAGRRAQDYAPFSPAWDAAVARVEDLERARWRIEQADPPPKARIA